MTQVFLKHSDSSEPILINLHNSDDPSDDETSNQIDICVIYFCSVLSLIFPLVGFIYITCTRNNTDWKTNVKILRAFLILIACTVIGIIWQSIIIILITIDTIHI